MYSHEERLKAVKLHVDSGMGLKGIMRTLGYPHDIKVCVNGAGNSSSPERFTK